MFLQVSSDDIQNTSLNANQEVQMDGDPDSIQQCVHLRELLDAEISVIRKHLSRHKWFRHIPDDDEGLRDFIARYGWIMREMYCGFACPDRDKCELAEKIRVEGDMDESSTYFGER